jgi:hypothetical protein
MTRQRYSKKEAWNRILRLFENKAVPDDYPNTISGVLLSEDEAISDLAELLADSLPSEDAILPPSLVASTAEANALPADAINTRALTPASHNWMHEYGGIYIVTGTVDQALLQNTWTKITGTFQNYTLDSGGEITCDWNDDRIIINEVGTYLVMYQLSLFTNISTAPTIMFEVFSSGSSQGQTRSQARFDVSGTCYVVSAFNPVSVPATGWPVDIRANPDVTGTVIRAMAGQLFVNKMNG